MKVPAGKNVLDVHALIGLGFGKLVANTAGRLSAPATLSCCGHSDGFTQPHLYFRPSRGSFLNSCLIFIIFSYTF